MVKKDLDLVSGIKSFDQRNAKGLGLKGDEHRHKCLAKLLYAKHNINTSHSTRKTNSIVFNVSHYE